MSDIAHEMVNFVCNNGVRDGDATRLAYE